MQNDGKIVSLRPTMGGEYGSLTLPVAIKRELGSPKKFRVALEAGAVVYRPVPVDDDEDRG